MLTSHLEQNVGLGEGKVGSFPETYNDLSRAGFRPEGEWFCTISRLYSKKMKGV